MIEEVLANIIQTYGDVGLFIAMIVQTIIAPIPSEGLLVLAGSVGIDMPRILVYGGTGMIVGSVIAFYIARLGRETLIKRLVGERWLKPVDRWVNRHGTIAILVARLVPVIPFDLVSYASGLTSLTLTKYVVATALGAYPRTLLLGLIGVGANRALASLGLSYYAILVLAIAAGIAMLAMEVMGVFDRIKELILSELTQLTLSQILLRKD